MITLPDFSRLRALVVGDLMIDRYVSGTVDRISPEAPVPVVRWTGTEDRLGGAANVALNLRALGVGAEVAGAVGTGAGAGTLEQLLDGAGIGRELLIRDADRPTTVKTRIVSQRQQLLRIDEEITAGLSASLTEDFAERLSAALNDRPFDLVLLQDYNKGVLTDLMIERTVTIARRHQCYLAVDPKATNFWAYRGVDLFKPNLREMQEQVNFTVGADRDSLDRAAAELFTRLGCRQVMITLSEHGIYVNDGERSAIYDTVDGRVADVSGAGDTVIALAGACRAAGFPLTHTARLANAAGAQVIARPGVVAVDLPDLALRWGATGDEQKLP